MAKYKTYTTHQEALNRGYTDEYTADEIEYYKKQHMHRRALLGRLNEKHEQKVAKSKSGSSRFEKFAKRVLLPIGIAAVAVLAKEQIQNYDSVPEPVNPHTIELTDKLNDAKTSKELKDINHMEGSYTIEADSIWRTDPMVFEDDANGKSNKVDAFDGKEVELSNPIVVTDLTNPKNGYWLGVHNGEAWVFTNQQNIEEGVKIKKIERLTKDNMPSYEIVN